MVEKPESQPRAEELLGPLEHAAMAALWHDAPADVATVLEAVNASRGDSELAYTTVMTVLSRLHDKGLVERVKDGRSYRYTPTFDEPALVEHLSRQQVDHLVDTFGTVALAQFAAALHASDPELLQRIAELAAEENDRG